MRFAPVPVQAPIATIVKVLVAEIVAVCDLSSLPGVLARIVTVSPIARTVEDVIVG